MTSIVGKKFFIINQQKPSKIHFLKYYNTSLYYKKNSQYIPIQLIFNRKYYD
uniref:Uncharacterized protein n=1 Tax=Octopus bimaculoides TaxID=37653 RepID=A0A0L8GWD9_OCTBM